VRDAMTSAHSMHIDAESFRGDGVLGKLRNGALGLGIVGIVLAILGYVASPEYFFRAYLVGWLFWLAIALGSLALIMIQHLTAGGWGLAVRRVLEASAWTLPILGILGIPVLLGMGSLYEWARPEAAHDHILALKAPYLNGTGFLIRYVLYFVIWTALAWSLAAFSRRQDGNGDPNLTVRSKIVSAPGLILYCLTLTFASIDWLMSLMPHWYSTMYGIYFIGCSGVAALTFTILVASVLSKSEPMSQILVRRHFHDYGNLLLAFLMLWAYFSFSQFLISWSGNLPEEVQWFEPRIHGMFGGLAVFIALFHFIVPFAFLLSASLKKRSSRLRIVAGWLLFMRWVDLFWQVEPNFKAEGSHPGLFWIYAVTPLAVGGIWLFFFVTRLRTAPLLPVRDPYVLDMTEAAAHAGH
jgi:hypothetical protein